MQARTPFQLSRGATADAGAEERPRPSAAVVARLFDQHAPYVGRTLRCLGVRDHELSDVLQEVFLLAHDRLPPFEHDAAARERAWLYAICVRKALSARRDAARRAVREVRDDARVAEAPGAQSPHDELERTRKLAQAMAILEQPDEDRRVVFVARDERGRRHRGHAAPDGVLAPARRREGDRGEPATPARTRDGRMNGQGHDDLDPLGEALLGDFVATLREASPTAAELAPARRAIVGPPRRGTPWLRLLLVLAFAAPAPSHSLEAHSLEAHSSVAHSSVVDASVTDASRTETSAIDLPVSATDDADPRAREIPMR